MSQAEKKKVYLDLFKQHFENCLRVWLRVYPRWKLTGFHHLSYFHKDVERQSSSNLARYTEYL